MAPKHVCAMAIPVGIHRVDLGQLPRKNPISLIIHIPD
jgi:hypothetical protein